MLSLSSFHVVVQVSIRLSIRHIISAFLPFAHSPRLCACRCKLHLRMRVIFKSIDVFCACGADNKFAKIKQTSVETNSHNCQKVRLCMSHGTQIYHHLLGWQPKMLIWAVGLVMQLVYSREDPTMESCSLLYIAAALSWIWLGHFDKVVRASSDKPEKPSNSRNHVHAFFEEIPKFLALIGIAILHIIEEDYEYDNKLAKFVGRRSKRFETEFQTKLRVDYANEILLLFSSIRSRASKVDRKKDGDSLFGHVTTPDLLIYGCAVHLFPDFSQHYNHQDFKVLSAASAFRRCLQMVSRLQQKQYPFEAVTLKSRYTASDFVTVYVPRAERRHQELEPLPTTAAAGAADGTARRVRAKHLKKQVQSLLAFKTLELVDGQWTVLRCVPLSFVVNAEKKMFNK